MTAAPLTSPTSASVEPPFLPPAGDFCQQRQKSPKTPLETAFQDFLTRVGYDFVLTCPTRNWFSGFSGSKDCASTAFRDALSRDAAPCRGGCLGALLRGYRQIFHHDGRLCPPRVTAVPLTSPTSASAEPPFLPPAGDFCQQRQKSPKTPLETAFQDFLTRVGYDFVLTCPTRNWFSGFSGSKDCASTAFRDALSRDAAPCRGGCLGALPRGYRQIFHHDGRLCPPRMTAAPSIRQGGLTQAGRKRSRRSLRSGSSPRPVPSSVSPPAPCRLTPWDPTG